MPTTPTYTVDIRDMSGTYLDSIPPKNLQFSRALNDRGTVGLQLPILHPQCTRALMLPGQRTIHISRNGTKVWGGYLLRADASSGDADEMVRFSGSGWFSIFDDRVIKADIIKDSVDQLDIAWSLINYANGVSGGNTGVTRFNPAESSGVLRTRHYRGWERANIADSLLDLAETNNGFDFEISPDKEWKTFYPSKGSDKSATVTFELGVSMQSMAYSEDAGNVVTEVSGMGAGQGRTRCIVTWRSDAAVTSFGLRQESMDFSRIRNRSDLSDRTRSALRYRKYSRAFPQMMDVTGVAPSFTSYEVGDRVRVKANYGYINFDKTMKIVSQNVQLSDEGTEANQLFFDDVPITSDEVEV